MHFKALAKCFISAVIAACVTQLASTAAFIRWASIQGDDFSKDFLDLALKSWHLDGLRMFLLWSIGALLLYLVLSKILNDRFKAERITTWILGPVTLFYALVLTASFSEYL